MLLDTSLIRDPWADQPVAVATVRQIDVRGEPVHSPTPVLHELWDRVARPGRQVPVIQGERTARRHLLAQLLRNWIRRSNGRGPIPGTSRQSVVVDKVDYRPE